MRSLPGISERVRGAIFYVLALAIVVVVGFFWPLIHVILMLVLALALTLEGLHALKVRHHGISWHTAIPGFIALLLALVFANSTAASGVTATTLFLSSGLLFLLISVLPTVMIMLIHRGPEGLADAVASVSMAMYVYGAFAVLGPLVLTVPRGMIWLLLALIAPAACDVFAYFGGVLFGKRQIIPKLSPKKTWAGTLFGTLGAVLLCLIFFLLWLKPALSVGGIMLLSLGAGIVLSLFAQFGDWLASAIKRHAGIKDFSKLIPGHGGLLDRLDSFLGVLLPVFILAVLVEYYFV